MTPLRRIVSEYLPAMPPACGAIAVGIASGASGGPAISLIFFLLWFFCWLAAVRYVNGMSRAFSWLLSATGAVVMTGCALNIHTWVSAPGASLEHPALLLDYARDFYTARTFALTGELSFPGNASYVTALGWLFRITGANVAVPLMMNSVLTWATIIAGARLSVFLLRPESAERERTMFMAGLCIASVANLLLMATVDLKDAGATLGFTCGAFSVAVAARGNLGTKGLIIGGAGALLLLVFKSQLAVFFLAGVVIVATRKGARGAANCIFLALLALGVLAAWHTSQMTVDTARSLSAHSLTSGLLNLEGMGFYGSLMGEYYFLPLWERILLTPFTSAVQSLMPLPWHFERDMALGAFFPYGHFTLPWYILFGFICAFYIFLIFRRGGEGLARWGIFWAVCYCGTAFFSCGTVARYYLPFIPMGVPLALRTFVVARMATASLRRKMKIWWAIYATGLCGALIAAYILLNN